MKENVFICDAYAAGFNIESVSLKSNNNDPSLTDLKLTRDSTNYTEIDNTTLYSIDGLLYPSKVETDGIYLINGNTTDWETVTLIRTNHIGEIIKSPISPDDLINLNDINTQTNTPIYLKTNFNLFEHSFILSLLGNIFINDNSVTVMDSNTLLIRQLSLDIDKKMLSANKIFYNNDLLALIINDTTVDYGKLLKFENLQKLFSTKNSFIIQFDRLVKIEKRELIGYDLPGRYMTDEYLDNLIVTDTNKVLEYKTIKNGWSNAIASDYNLANLSRNRTAIRENISTITNDLPYYRRYENAFIYDLKK